MKVIVAGYAKTGTKSMNMALQQLGYTVHDSPDQFWYHCKEWTKILSAGNGGSIKDFQDMYKDIDAVVDVPASTFWEEIYQAFPESKIILTTRDENKQYKSYCKQVEQARKNWLFYVVKMTSFTGWRFQSYFSLLAHYMFPVPISHSRDCEFIKNEMVMKKTFRQHQRYCMQNAPPDKLLVYHVSEGWEPLCKFLGKEVPDTPFPHENIAGRLMDDLLARHPAFIRMKRESGIMLSLFVIFAALAIGYFFL